MSFLFSSCGVNPFTLPSLPYIAPPYLEELSNVEQVFDWMDSACTSYPDPSNHAGKESQKQNPIITKSKSPSNNENIEVTLQGYKNSTNPLYKKWPYDEMDLDKSQTCNDNDTASTVSLTDDEPSFDQDAKIQINSNHRNLLENLMSAKKRIYEKFRKIFTNKTVQPVQKIKPVGSFEYFNIYNDDNSAAPIDLGYQKSELNDTLSRLVDMPKHTKKSDSIGTQNNQHDHDSNSLNDNLNTPPTPNKSPVPAPKINKYQEYLNRTITRLGSLGY